MGRCCCWKGAGSLSKKTAWSVSSCEGQGAPQQHQPAALLAGKTSRRAKQGNRSGGATTGSPHSVSAHQVRERHEVCPCPARRAVLLRACPPVVLRPLQSEDNRQQFRTRHNRPPFQFRSLSRSAAAIPSRRGGRGAGAEGLEAGAQSRGWVPLGTCAGRPRTPRTRACGGASWSRARRRP